MYDGIRIIKGNVSSSDISKLNNLYRTEFVERLRTTYDVEYSESTLNKWWPRKD